MASKYNEHIIIASLLHPPRDSILLATSKIKAQNTKLARALFISCPVPEEAKKRKMQKRRE